MQLYLRREMITSKHGIGRQTRTQFHLYARLTLIEVEKHLIVDFDLADAVLVTSEGDVVRGEKAERPSDVAELVNGHDFNSPSFPEMLRIEEGLAKGCENLRGLLDKAAEVRAQHETVAEF